MGFSLKMFFEDLEHELNTGSMWTRLARIKRVIEEAKAYAKICRQI
jgi:hypothetical protein